MEESRSNSFEALLRLGTVIGLYLTVQAAGYLQGLGEVRPSSTLEGVLKGISHLEPIFRPWGIDAWPLTPVLCGLLLVYTVYLPAQLQTESGGVAARMNRVYFAVLVPVSVTAIAAATHSEDLFSGLAVGLDDPWL